MKTYQETGPGKCNGQYSIQHEINQIIKDQGGDDWAKKIGDKTYREKIRLKLQRTKTEWCDYRAKTCACED